jgi:hypothetical protein
LIYRAVEGALLEAYSQIKGLIEVHQAIDLIDMAEDNEDELDEFEE